MTDTATDKPDIAQMFEAMGEAYEARDFDRALAICQDIARIDQTPGQATQLYLALKKLGQEEGAAQIRDAILAGLESNRASLWDSAEALVEMGNILGALDAPEKAEEAFRRAHELEPSNALTVVALNYCLLSTGRADEALALACTAIDGSTDPAKRLKHLSVVFGHFDAVAQGLALVEHARPRCISAADRKLLVQVEGVLSGKESALDQHDSTVKLFDKFAEDYDEKLAVLGNNGPNVILNTLRDLDLPERPDRRILDAGCGTGLCAPFLKLLGGELHGVDLSVGMLEKCRAKGEYDFLARTDLSAIHTYPEGSFDLIVSGDVLVYFGALEQVFANFMSVLTPGGWLVFTVEDGGDAQTGPGFRLHTSGRHRHTEAYLRQVLRGCGFSAPKVVKRERLRNELGTPIIGIAMAAQRPALLFAQPSEASGKNERPRKQAGSFRLPDGIEQHFSETGGTPTGSAPFPVQPTSSSPEK